MSTWLMHVGRETVYDQIGGVGLFTFPPNEPIRIDDDYLASTILEHKAQEGLVRVPIITNKQGLIFDTEAAAKAARQALAEGRDKLIKGYIASCQDRIQAGKPPLPPSPRVSKLIEEDGIDLAAEGINLGIAGFKVGGQAKDMLEKMAKLESNLDMLIEQNRLLQEQNKLLKDQSEAKPKAGRG